MPAATEDPPKCYDAGYRRHQNKDCAGPAGLSVDWLDTNNWNHFCPPSSRVEPRRSAFHTDNDRVFKIKNDPMVQMFQLYGNLQSSRQVKSDFTHGYAYNNVPAMSSTGSRCNGRMRYVFGIEPRQDSAGIRAVQPQRSSARHALDAEGYIGNLAIAIVGMPPNKQRSLLDLVYPGTQLPELEPKPGKIFDFWGQGIMGEAISAILPFIFQVLHLPSVIIDPLVGNTSSVRLAQKLGFARRPDKITPLGTKHHVFELTRAMWESQPKGKKERNKKKKARKAGANGGGEADDAAADDADPPEVALSQSSMDRACCRWCQIPSHRCTLGCSGCQWAFWCSQACKTADLTYAGGHATECDREEGGSADEDEEEDDEDEDSDEYDEDE
ncbi:hypothetical protein JCM10207_003432 [Rhodosporidiobolus poonsookiae]